jgi:hypothetical protein
MLNKNAGVEFFRTGIFYLIEKLTPRSKAESPGRTKLAQNR